MASVNMMSLFGKTRPRFPKLISSALCLVARQKVLGYVCGSHFSNFVLLNHNSKSCRQYFSHSHNVRSLSNEAEPNVCKGFDEEDLNKKFNVIADKIIFNSILQHSTLSWNKTKYLENKERKERLNKVNKNDPGSNIPIALKYLKNEPQETRINNTDKEKTVSCERSDELILPYNIRTQIERNDIKDSPSIPELQGILKPDPDISSWMSDYECFEEGEEVSIDRPWELNYGTPDSNVPSSSVPCGGCGAFLHCRDASIPGYLPSEIFRQQDEATLRSLVCQRCHFMRYYDTALNVIVPPEDYPRLMSHLQNKIALIVLMVDILDFPCSIWPGIMDIIGKKHPIIVVGNKVDLLPPDSRGYLHRIKESLTENLKYCDIPDKKLKHVALISAKTGYGVEELITKIHNIWEYKGDIYLLGCTNVGKSTLFNALLQSDLCKIKAVDLIQRATTSPWPGTTIKLLKFPMLRPAGWRLYERTRRLMSEKAEKQAEEKLHRMQLKEKPRNLPALIGHIGMTFYQKDPCESVDPFSLGKGMDKNKPQPLSGLDPNDEDYAKSKWCYDTPGAVHPDQLIHLLTIEELMLTLPKKLILPRTFKLAPGMSLFIAGLGRLDFTQGDEPIRMTVFASYCLPITICKSEDADEVYQTLLGSKLMAVPQGGASRLAQWPGLKLHAEELELQGISYKESCGDILLSSAGWVAVTPRYGKKCKFRAWSPNGRGVYVRKPAVLPFAVDLCGRKQRQSPAYGIGKAVFQQV